MEMLDDYLQVKPYLTTFYICMSLLYIYVHVQCSIKKIYSYYTYIAKKNKKKPPSLMYSL